MAVFYTVNEAAAVIGRSPTSVRRILRPIVKDEQHADRQYIQPSTEEVRELRMKGEGFAWLISEELLSRELAARQAEGDKTNASPHPSATDNRPFQELVTTLREQLQHSQGQLVVKDQQIAVKDQQIASLSQITSSLNDRLHEGNVLLATLQKQLALPEASVARTSASKEPTKKTDSPSPRSASKKAEPKPVSPATKKPPKKGFFARLFS
jgi:hypothetical protein